uniref:Lactamase_B domain-containing protein n=1 Tax=Panagrellus redivivus TaxID=6233 RepID=A0A7E4ZZ54_PANRE
MEEKKQVEVETAPVSLSTVRDWFDPILSKVTVLNQEVVFENEEVQVVQLLGRDQSQVEDGIVKSTASLVRLFATESEPEFVMLFDCGGIEDVDELHAGLTKYNVKSIDVLVISHHHIDHFGGRPFLKIKPATVFTNKSIPIERDFHFFRDNLIAFRTPGHSKGDISVLVYAKKRIVLCGDVFDSDEDVNSFGWVEQSNNRTTQERSQSFVLAAADIVVPGHGPAFELQLEKVFIDPIQCREAQRITKSADGTAYLLKGYGINKVAITTSSNMDPDELFGQDNGVEFILHAGLEEVTNPPKRQYPRMYLDPDLIYYLGDNDESLPHAGYDSVLGKTHFKLEKAAHLSVTRMPFFGGRILPVVELLVLSENRYIPIQFPGATDRESQIINDLVLSFRFNCPPLSDVDIEVLDAVPEVVFDEPAGTQ